VSEQSAYGVLLGCSTLAYCLVLVMGFRGLWVDGGESEMGEKGGWGKGDSAR